MYNFLVPFILAATLATTTGQLQDVTRPILPDRNNQYANTNNAPSLEPQPEGYQSTYVRFNNFDIDLFQSYSNGQNFFISPASIKTTLVMLLEGAYGHTAEEIAFWLRISTDIKVVRELLAKFLIDLQDPSGNTVVESINGVFVSKEETVKRSYRQALEKHYKSFVREVDFSDQYRTTNEINEQVSATTRGKIPELLGQGSLGPDTRMVVINALYFKGLWKTMFEKAMPGCFYSVRSNCINVDMMHVEDTFNYKFFDELDAHVVELPYNGDKYSMLLVVPNQRNGINILFKDISHLSFRSIVDGLEPTDIMFGMPKFELEYTTDVIPVLEKIGIKELFTPQANISGILENSSAFVSKFIHKTKVEVTERGTEAAAASGAVFIPLMGNSKPRIFADHPFAFFIFHKPTKTIIFEGVLHEPKEKINVAQKTESSYTPVQVPKNQVYRTDTQRTLPVDDRSQSRQPINQVQGVPHTESRFGEQTRFADQVQYQQRQRFLQSYY